MGSNRGIVRRLHIELPRFGEIEFGQFLSNFHAIQTHHNHSYGYRTGPATKNTLICFGLNSNEGNSHNMCHKVAVLDIFLEKFNRSLLIHILLLLDIGQVTFNSLEG